MLDELKEALSEKLIELQYDKKICDYLAEKCDGSKRGARELRNIIRREIENRIVDIIIENKEGDISSVTLSAEDEIKIDIRKAN